MGSIIDYNLLQIIQSRINMENNYSNYIPFVPEKNNVALVAHDFKKKDLLEWARYNKPVLSNHIIYATGTTGSLLEEDLSIPVIKLKSGPLGGDQ